MPKRDSLPFDRQGANQVKTEARIMSDIRRFTKNDVKREKLYA